MLRVDVDGAAHAVFRDDGGVVRAGGPAFVLSVLVEPGDRVAEGDPLAVVESMKMENTITAPFGGAIAAVEARRTFRWTRARQSSASRPRASMRARGRRRRHRRPARPTRLAAVSCERVYDALRSYLLGYDLDPGSVQTMLSTQRELSQTAAPADTDLMRCEDALLDLFAEVSSLYRPRGEIEPEMALLTGSTQEYLLSYLQWLDADRAGLPDSYRSAAGAGAAALRRARTGPHPRTRGSGRLDVPLFPPGRRARAGGYRHPRAPAAPPRQAGAAGRPRDAGPA